MVLQISRDTRYKIQAGFKIPPVTNVLSLDESFNPSISLSAINLAGVAVSC